MGEGAEGAAKAAGAADRPSTAEATSAAVPRRTVVMAGGASPAVLRRDPGTGTLRHLGSGSVCLDGAGHRRLPMTRAGHDLVRGIPTCRHGGRLTVAGQRRIRTGFPPYG
ncbi:hypothetical protein GCM10010271_57510 [Streptomyces kurssanovii]|nr:hypothetical protein GCM10010271_57510 [Streptomyces kurssanovii]